MAVKKRSKASAKKQTGRPKPLVHTPGLTKTRRRFDCGGKISKSS